jgi:hypothetical protein
VVRAPSRALGEGKNLAKRPTCDLGKLCNIKRGPQCLVAYVNICPSLKRIIIVTIYTIITS